MLSDDDRDMLILYGVPGVGTKLHARLVAQFGSAGEVFRASKRALTEVDGIGEAVASSIMSFDRNRFIREQTERMEKTGAVLVTRSNPDYPPLLGKFKSAPPVLFVRGNTKSLLQPSIAFVGTRKPSDYGIRMTRKLVDGMTAAGMCIISGMAVGIDSTAHRAAIESDGTTIAVFGCGVDIIYPSFNRKLAENIMKTGALVSHFPMGTSCMRGNFPARNAVIVGLSQATVVVEAPSKSGALITADLTLKAGRPLFTVPGNADSPTSAGTNNLITKGAHPIVTSEMILAVLGGPVMQQPPLPGKTPAESRIQPEGLAGELLTVMGNQSMQLDVICVRVKRPVSEVLNELTLLEMDGFIVQKPGKFYARRR